jgi:hypothetical protein
MRNSLNAQRAGLADRVRLIEAPSYEALPSLLKERAKLDFAFIDGMHTFDYALLDFFYVDKLLSPGGYVAFDDLWMPAIRKVIAFVLRNRSYELVKLEARSSFQQQTGTIRVYRSYYADLSLICSGILAEQRFQLKIYSCQLETTANPCLAGFSS